MLVSVVLSLAISSVYELEPLEFEARGERLDAVVERLAEATGQALVVGEEGSSHHLAIFNKTLTADELIAGIARVTASQWIPDRGTMRLVPDRETRQAMFDEDLAERADVFKKSIEDWKEKIKAGESGEQIIRDGGAVIMRTPYMQNISSELANRTGAEILDHIDPLTVAKLRTGDRIVFSSQANSRQLRLRPLPATFLPELSRDYRAGAGEPIDSATYRDQLAEQRQGLADLGLDGYLAVPTPETAIVKVVAAVTCISAEVSHFSSYVVRIMGFTLEDGRHKQVFAFHIELEAQIDDAALLAQVPAGLTAPAQVELGEGVEQTRQSIALWVQSGVGFHRAPADVQNYLLNPTANNPREDFYAPYYQALADANEINLVAVIPEDAYSAYLTWLAGPFPFFAFIEIAAVSEVVDKTLYSSPWNLDHNAAIAVDDRWMEEYFRDNSGFRSLPLRAQIAYIADRGNWRYTDPARPVMEAVFKPSAFRQNILSLKLLSYATSTELDRILTEGSFRFGALSPELKREVERSVYSLYTPPLKDTGPLPQTWFGYKAHENRAWTRNIHRVEPTELLPNGIPDDAVWDTTIYREYGFIHDGIAGDAWFFPGPVHTIQLIQYTEPGSTLGRVGSQQRPSTYFIGDKSYYEFRLRLADSFTIGMSATDLPIANDARSYHLSEFLSDVQAHVDRIRQLMIEDGRFLSDGGRTAPPP